MCVCVVWCECGVCECGVCECGVCECGVCACGVCECGVCGVVNVVSVVSGVRWCDVW